MIYAKFILIKWYTRWGGGRSGEKVASSESNEEGEGTTGEEAKGAAAESEGGVSGGFDTLIKQIANIKRKKGWLTYSK